jgi:hypothetical protein
MTSWRSAPASSTTRGQYAQAFVYQRPAGGWSGARRETATLRVPQRVEAGTCGVPGEVGAAQAFGTTIAIAGKRIVASAGAHSSGRRHFLGKACVFTRPATGWADTITEAQTFTPSVGATNKGRGAAYLFDLGGDPRSARAAGRPPSSAWVSEPA